MDANLRSTLKALVLDLRHELEGQHDAQGKWQPGDLERRLAAIGVRADRFVPASEMKLSTEDRDARRIVDAFIGSRLEAGESAKTRSASSCATARTPGSIGCLRCGVWSRVVS